MLHIAFSIYSVYYYVISNFGNIGALDFVVGCVAGLSRSKLISHMYNGSPFLKDLEGTSSSGCTYSAVRCDPRFFIILTGSKSFIGYNCYICARVRSDPVQL